MRCSQTCVTKSRYPCGLDCLKGGVSLNSQIPHTRGLVPATSRGDKSHRENQPFLPQNQFHEFKLDGIFGKSPCDLFLKTLSVNCSWDKSVRPVLRVNYSGAPFKLPQRSFELLFLKIQCSAVILVEPSLLICQLNPNCIYFQAYLQSFIGLCSRIPDCPISSMTGRPLTKRDLCDFAPFFKQGIFEQTKHYSGQSSGELQKNQ